MNSSVDSEQRRRWHIGKEIPLAVIATLIVQTTGVVWWAAGITHNSEKQTAAIATLTVTVASMDERLRLIEISRAQRTGKLDGEIAEQSRNNQDQEMRLRKLEQRR